jgi:hypothetical protein
VEALRAQQMVEGPGRPWFGFSVKKNRWIDAFKKQSGKSNGENAH